MASQADDLQMMLKQKMDAFLKSDAFRDIISKSIRDVLSDAVEAVVSPFKQAIEKFDERLQDAIDAAVTHLKNEIQNLHHKLDEVKMQSNDNEQYSRRNNIRIYGIDGKEGEDCYDEVI